MATGHHGETTEVAFEAEEMHAFPQHLFLKSFFIYSISPYRRKILAGSQVTYMERN